MFCPCSWLRPWFSPGDFSAERNERVGSWKSFNVRIRLKYRLTYIVFGDDVVPIEYVPGPVAADLHGDGGIHTARTMLRTAVRRRS